MQFPVPYSIDSGTVNVATIMLYCNIELNCSILLVLTFGIMMILDMLLGSLSSDQSREVGFNISVLPMLHICKGYPIGTSHCLYRLPSSVLSAKTI